MAPFGRVAVGLSQSPARGSIHALAGAFALFEGPSRLLFGPAPTVPPVVGRVWCTRIRRLCTVASMTEMLLFHHAQGQTEGFHAFADELRAAGHVVHTPDLYDGKTFAELTDGVAYAKQVGFDVLLERGVAAAERLPADIVYGGFSLGVLPAQKLAQTRPGARGALLLHACFPPSEFGTPWPDGVPVQIHAMDADEWFQEDAAAAQELVDEVENAELYLYPGDGHLFTDSSLSDFDEEAAALLKERILAFLKAVE